MSGCRIDIEGIAPGDIAGLILQPEGQCLIISLLGVVDPTEAEVIPGWKFCSSAVELIGNSWDPSGTFGARDPTG